MKTRRNKYDSLEKLFRSRLSNTTEAENKWNIPPDSAWLAAQQKMADNQIQSNRRIPPIWIIFGLILFALAGFHLNPLHHIPSIDQDIAHINSEITKLKDQSTEGSQITAEIIHPGKAPSARSYETAIISRSSDGLSEEGTPQEATLKSGENENSKYSGIQSIASKVPIHAEPSLQSNDIVNEQAEGPYGPLANDLVNSQRSNINQKFIPIGPNEPQVAEDRTYFYPQIPTLSFMLIHKKRDLGLSNTLEARPNQEIIKDRWQAYFFGGYLLSSLRMTNTEGNDFSLTKYDQQYAGYQLGMGVKLPLTRDLLLNTRLSYSKVNNKSFFNEMMAYDPSKEQLDSSGELMYQTDLRVESPMGSFGTNVRFSVDDQNISQDEMLDNKTHIFQDFELLKLSLGIDYIFARTGKIDYLLSGGISGNYLFHFEQDMDTKLFYSDTMLMDKSFNTQSMEEVKSYFVSFYGNIGLKYNADNGLYWQLNGGLEHAISSLRNTHISNPSNTYLNHWMAQLSLGYSF